jgi:hypothetical protein
MTNIYQAIPAIMAEIGAISKDRKNTAQNYSFRGIDDVYNAIHGLLIKYKVFTVPEIVEAKDESVTNAKGTILFYTRLLMKYTFYAEDGSSFSAIVRGEGMDSGDKASNKAMAVAHKYALIQVFAIPTENGDDPEESSHDIRGEKPAAQPIPAQAEPGRGAAIASLSGRISALNKTVGDKLIDDFHRDLSQAKGVEAQSKVVAQWEHDMAEKKGAA